jgi:hypothetical protein
MDDSAVSDVEYRERSRLLLRIPVMVTGVSDLS